MNEYVIIKIFADHKVVWEKKNIFPHGFLLNRKTGFVGDGDKRVHSEISRGGYVTSDDELALPNFLVHLPSQNYVIMDINVEEGLNERVNCGDLDDGGDNARYSELLL